jgi:hypothetical protein
MFLSETGGSCVLAWIFSQPVPATSFITISWYWVLTLQLLQGYFQIIEHSYGHWPILQVILGDLPSGNLT